MNLPVKALSVRQPWAWAILRAGKDVENRSAAALRHMRIEPFSSIALHASKGMTRDEYEEAAEFMATLGVVCPAPNLLPRGGIVGAFEVEGVVSASASPWFFGPRGIALKRARACEFVAARGALGLFDWRPLPDGGPEPPARWMTPKPGVVGEAPPPELPL